MTKWAINLSLVLMLLGMVVTGCTGPMIGSSDGSGNTKALDDSKELIKAYSRSVSRTLGNSEEMLEAAEAAQIDPSEANVESLQRHIDYTRDSAGDIAMSGARLTSPEDILEVNAQLEDKTGLDLSTHLLTIQANSQETKDICVTGNLVPPKSIGKLDSVMDIVHDQKWAGLFSILKGTWDLVPGTATPYAGAADRIVVIDETTFAAYWYEYDPPEKASATYEAYDIVVNENEYYRMKATVTFPNSFILYYWCLADFDREDAPTAQLYFTFSYDACCEPEPDRFPDHFPSRFGLPYEEPYDPPYGAVYVKVAP